VPKDKTESYVEEILDFLSKWKRSVNR
jgi:hypothetical protein